MWTWEAMTLLSPPSRAGGYTMNASETAKERFWSKVKKDTEDKCWPWIGARSQRGKGYGEYFLGGKLCQAHRIAWGFAKGEIPEGMCILHKCDNRACVNPNHLFVGTHSDNIVDMVKKGRCYNRKVTDETVREIRKSNLSSTKAAQIYGVCPAHIRKIRLRRAAAHVN
jgi:hypothetical protein